jgi:hypothetical protein
MAQENKTALLKELSSCFAQLKQVDKAALKYLSKDLKGTILEAKDLLQKIPNIESEEEFDDYETFRLKMMPLIIDHIEDYIDRTHNEKLNKGKGKDQPNLGLAAVNDFLNIENIGSWKGAFEVNSAIDSYLKNLYEKYTDEVTEFSLEKYALVAAKNIWLNMVGKGTLDANINQYDLGNPNPLNFQLSESLASIKSTKLIPKGLESEINSFQEKMLAEQPDGFSTFIVEWKELITHIGSYDNFKREHASQSKKQNNLNLQNMYAVLEKLLAADEYFTFNDYIAKEKIKDQANTENHSAPNDVDNKKNSKKDNISKTTGAIFDADYVRPDKDITTILKEFNGTAIPFVAAPVLPGLEMKKEELDAWLKETGVLDGEIQDGSIKKFAKSLSDIANYLNKNETAVIKIEGHSTYLVDGKEYLAVKIANARAEKIRKILVNDFGAPASQIITDGIYSSKLDIGIVITLESK